MIIGCHIIQVYVLLQEASIFYTDHEVKLSTVTVQHDTAARITLLIQIEDSLTKYIKQTAKRNIETNMFHFNDFQVVRLIPMHEH